MQSVSPEDPSRELKEIVIISTIQKLQIKHQLMVIDLIRDPRSSSLLNTCAAAMWGQVGPPVRVWPRATY
jgi:hypothetical protein